MHIVNISNHIVAGTMCGTMKPGMIATDTRYCDRLRDEMKEVVRRCGNSLAIRFSDEERELFNALRELDEKGMKFDKSMLSVEAREDPTGAKRNAAAKAAAQRDRLSGVSEANRNKSMRNSFINGESIGLDKHDMDHGVKKTGPSSELKSGFASILEENAKIAAKKPVDARETPDPFGARSEKHENASDASAELNGIVPNGGNGLRHEETGPEVDGSPTGADEGAIHSGPSKRRGRKNRF